MSEVKVLFASGSDEVVAQTLREFKNLFRMRRWWWSPSFRRLKVTGSVTTFAAASARTAR